MVLSKALAVGLLLAAASCSAPIGTKAVNPACVVHCTVTVQDSRVFEPQMED